MEEDILNYLPTVMFLGTPCCSNYDRNSQFAGTRTEMLNHCAQPDTVQDLHRY